MICFCLYPNSPQARGIAPIATQTFSCCQIKAKNVQVFALVIWNHCFLYSLTCALLRCRYVHSTKQFIRTSFTYSKTMINLINSIRYNKPLAAKKTDWSFFCKNSCCPGNKFIRRYRVLLYSWSAAKWLCLSNDLRDSRGRRALCYMNI